MRSYRLSLYWGVLGGGIGCACFTSEALSDTRAPHESEESEVADAEADKQGAEDSAPKTRPLPLRAAKLAAGARRCVDEVTKLQEGSSEYYAKIENCVTAARRLAEPLLLPLMKQCTDQSTVESCTPLAETMCTLLWAVPDKEGSISERPRPEFRSTHDWIDSRDINVALKAASRAWQKVHVTPDYRKEIRVVEMPAVTPLPSVCVNRVDVRVACDSAAAVRKKDFYKISGKWTVANGNRQPIKCHNFDGNASDVAIPPQTAVSVSVDAISQIPNLAGPTCYVALDSDLADEFKMAKTLLFREGAREQCLYFDSESTTVVQSCRVSSNGAHCSKTESYLPSEEARKSRFVPKGHFWRG